MKFDYCSDLHVDKWYHTTRIFDRDSGPQPWTTVDGVPKYQHIDWNWMKTSDARVLVIAGDISNDLRQTADTIRDAARSYEQVVFVEGNHDHYQEALAGEVTDNQQALADELADLSNVMMLNGKRAINIDGTLFIGALGWYDWRAFEDQGITYEQARDRWNNGNNDSRYIDFGGFKSPDIAAMNDAELLRKQVLEAQDNPTVRNIVVVTHTSPRADLMEWMEGRDLWNALTPSFVNTMMSRVLDADTQGKIKKWVYGHTHFRKVIELDGVTYLNSARGYPRENEPWLMMSEVVE